MNNRILIAEKPRINGLAQIIERIPGNVDIATTPEHLKLCAARESAVQNRYSVAIIDPFSLYGEQKLIDRAPAQDHFREVLRLLRPQTDIDRQHENQTLVVIAHTTMGITELNLANPNKQFMPGIDFNTTHPMRYGAQRLIETIQQYQ